MICFEKYLANFLNDKKFTSVCQFLYWNYKKLNFSVQGTQHNTYMNQITLDEAT